MPTSLFAPLYVRLRHAGSRSGKQTAVHLHGGLGWRVSAETSRSLPGQGTLRQDFLQSGQHVCCRCAARESASVYVAELLFWRTFDNALLKTDVHGRAHLYVAVRSSSLSLLCSCTDALICATSLTELSTLVSWPKDTSAAPRPNGTATHLACCGDCHETLSVRHFLACVFDRALQERNPDPKTLKLEKRRKRIRRFTIAYLPSPISIQTLKRGRDIPGRRSHGRLHRRRGLRARHVRRGSHRQRHRDRLLGRPTARQGCHRRGNIGGRAGWSRCAYEVRGTGLRTERSICQVRLGRYGWPGGVGHRAGWRVEGWVYAEEGLEVNALL